MKKTVVSFVISALVLAGLVLWAVKGKVFTDASEILMVLGALLVVGFGVFMGMKRVQSHRRKEPPEDELSKRILTRASSLAYYISLYQWLLVMYLSDRVEIPTHSLIGAGILGMAIIFMLSWIWVKVWGTKIE